MAERVVQLLVVEDDEAHIELIRRAFASLAAHGGSFRLTVAHSLREARVRLREAPCPDLVISDLILPDGWGTELLAEAEQGTRFPVVLMTSFGNEHIAVEAMKAGASEYVVKSAATLADLPCIARDVIHRWSNVQTREQAERELRDSQERTRTLLAESEAARSALLSILEDEKRAQEEVRRVNRALHALSDCNQAVIRAVDEAELLAAICQVVVESGEYRAVWVGYIKEDAARSVRTVAQAGFEAGVLEALEITWADTQRGQGAIGQAIRTNLPVMAPQSGEDPVLALWEAGAGKGEAVCSLSLPLFVDGKPLGALNIYSRAADVFDAQEIGLLSEMAGDLAYGIEALRTRSAHARAEVDLRLYRELTNQSNDAIFVIEPDTSRVLDVNETAGRLLGYSREEFLNLRVADFDPCMRDITHWAEHWQAVRAAGALLLETTQQRKDGTILPVEVSVRYTVQDQKDYMIAVVRNITERKQMERERQAHLHFFECMDRVNRAIQATSDVDQMLSDVLDVVLSAFDCDRASLVYPCDPETPMWSVPMERTRPEFPGAHAERAVLSIDSDVAETFRIVLAAEEPVQFGPGTEHPLPPDIAERYGFQSYISQALYPKHGAPWQFLMHQCSRARLWTVEETRLFQEIGWRLADGLTSRLTLHNLRESEARLAEAQRIAKIGNWEWDVPNNALWWSDEAFRIFDIPPQEFGGTFEAFVSAIHPEDRERVQASIKQALQADSRGWQIDYRISRSDGTVRFVHEETETIFDPGGKPLRRVGTVQDITERKQAEEALRRLNRELRAISNCNQTLLRAEDEPSLLNEICRIICDEAGYRMAWVGYAEHDAAKTIRPAARAGLDSGYIESAKLSWADDTERGRGPAGIAIRSGEIVYIQDFETDPRMVPWREIALQRGYRSGISLPLIDKNANVFGVLLIYHSEAKVVSPDEIRLMEQLAADLSFGITVLRDRAERERAERKLLAKTEELDHFFSLSLDLLCIADTDGYFARLNPSWERTLGHPLAELQRSRFFDFIHPNDVESTQDAVATLETQHGVTDFINRYRCADGSYRWLEWRSAPVGKRIYAVARDISERREAEEALLRSERQKTILNQIASVVLSVHDEEMYGDVLTVVLDALQSKYGIFGYLSDDEDLIIPSMTRDVWSQCQIPDKSIVFPSSSWGTSLWGRAIREMRTFVSDGPFHLPAGHMLINCFLTTPIVFVDRTIGLLSVANREGGYGEEDVALLETIAGYLAPILNARLQRDRLEQERKRADERIMGQLREKELLVREIHHRVKNNMQVISSLLDLQIRQSGNEQLRELLTVSRGRIRTMAMVHERLYTAQDMARINLRDYIQTLVAESLGLYGVSPGQVEVRVDVEQWTLAIATAIPCGLIIHELLSNALRHAFPGGRKGCIEISLVRTRDGWAKLIVRDDGVGVPRDLDLDTTDSLGLRLVRILATDQLGGDVSLERVQGTKVQVRFPEAQS